MHNVYKRYDPEKENLATTTSSEEESDCKEPALSLLILVRRSSAA
jgi:hypothetical protein